MKRVGNLIAFVVMLCAWIGCTGNSIPPAPAQKSTVESNSATSVIPDTDQVAEQIGKEISKQLDKSVKDLEKMKLVLLVDSIRDVQHKGLVVEQAEKLIDAQSGNSSVLSKGGYGDSYLISVSPVSDFEAAVNGIKFGAIIAADPEQRTIVVDAAAEPTPRPAIGWPGSDALREFSGRKTAAWALSEADANLIKKLGAGNAIVVCYPGSTEMDDWSDSIDAKLQKLTGGSGVSTSYTSDSQGDVRISTLGPVASLQAVAAVLEGNILWTDEERRVIVLERPKIKKSDDATP